MLACASSLTSAVALDHNLPYYAGSNVSAALLVTGCCSNAPAGAPACRRRDAASQGAASYQEGFPRLDPECPDAYRRLAYLCLRKEPEARPTALQALEELQLLQ